MDDRYHIWFKFTGFWDTKDGIIDFGVCHELENIDFMSKEERVLFLSDLILRLSDFLEVDLNDE